MKTRLLTVELDLDKSGVQTVEERRASKGVFNIQPLSIYIPVTHTVILRLAAKRSNGWHAFRIFKAHAKNREKECLFLFSSVLKIVLKWNYGSGGGINYKKLNKAKTAQATCEAHEKQVKLKRVEVASSWLDFPLLFSAGMDLTRG